MVPSITAVWDLGVAAFLGVGFFAAGFFAAVFLAGVFFAAAFLGVGFLAGIIRPRTLRL